MQESDEQFGWGTVDLDGLRMFVLFSRPPFQSIADLHPPSPPFFTTTQNSYLARSLAWDQTKTDSLVLPLINRENQRKAGKLKGQKQVTDLCASPLRLLVFSSKQPWRRKLTRILLVHSFDYSAGYQPFSKKKAPKYASKRLQNVVSVRHPFFPSFLFSSEIDDFSFSFRRAGRRSATAPTERLREGKMRKSSRRSNRSLGRSVRVRSFPSSTLSSVLR